MQTPSSVFISFETEEAVNRALKWGEIANDTTFLGEEIEIE